MANTYFLGMRGTLDFVTNERPEDWRQGIMYLFPNGTAPLTALTSMMPQVRTTDPRYHWWEEQLPTQCVTTTGIYTDAALTTAYNPGVAATAGTVLYVKMAAADTVHFRQGHQVLMRDASNLTVDANAKVIGVVVNGANSNVAVRMLEDDDNGVAGDLGDMDTLLVIGTINPEGGTRPEAITVSPEEYWNYTQIFRNSLDLSRTAMETKYRTADLYAKAKKDALQFHSIEMEKAFLFGIRTQNLGINGKPERTTGGLIPWVKGQVFTDHGVLADFLTDFPAGVWTTDGDTWLDATLEQIFRNGSRERLAFAGSGAMLGIHRLVRALGQYTITQKTTAFGMSVDEWITPFGTLYVKVHPLFSYEATNRNAMLIVEPSNLIYRYVTDTKFQADTRYGDGGGDGFDGKQEEFLTECGLEMHHVTTTGWMTGFNTDAP